MAGFMRNLLVDSLLPENLAGLAVHGEDDKFVLIGCGEIIMSAGTDKARLDRTAVRDGGRQKNPIAPDDRRGVALAGQRYLPADILVFAPFDRRVGAGRYA